MLKVNVAYLSFYSQKYKSIITSTLIVLNRKLSRRKWIAVMDSYSSFFLLRASTFNVFFLYTYLQQCFNFLPGSKMSNNKALKRKYSTAISNFTKNDYNPFFPLTLQLYKKSMGLVLESSAWHFHKRVLFKKTCSKYIYAEKYIGCRAAIRTALFIPIIIMKIFVTKYLEDLISILWNVINSRKSAESHNNHVINTVCNVWFIRKYGALSSTLIGWWPLATLLVIYWNVKKVRQDSLTFVYEIFTTAKILNKNSNSYLWDSLLFYSKLHR